jgi:hypothetical protein
MTMAKSIREYREMLSSEDIKTILKNLGVEPLRENHTMILYRTVCHNNIHDHSASAKLYYYKKNNMFKCYTECNSVFDIFELIIKIKRQEGEDISLRQAIKICGIEAESVTENQYYGMRDQLDYLYEINQHAAEEPEILKTYPLEILRRYIFDLNILKVWIEEDIPVDTLIKYNIKADTISSAIIIPYFTDTKELIGIRGRFLSEDAKAKYMPIKYNNEYLAHPISKILFGLDINKEAIHTLQTAIIFEGEKSVMKMDAYYGNKNIALATSGRHISREQINLLLKYGVKNLVLAFDRDYKSHREIEQEINAYYDMLKHVQHFFNISFIIDYDFELNHKNSPIDQGKELFEKLLKRKIIMR